MIFEASDIKEKQMRAFYCYDFSMQYKHVLKLIIKCLDSVHSKF